MTEERLTWHFANWAEWQRDRPSDFGRGYPRKASGGAVSSSSGEFDSMVAEADMCCAIALDHILDSVTAIERAADLSLSPGGHLLLPAGRSKCRARVSAGARVAVHAGLIRRGIE